VSRNAPLIDGIILHDVVGTPAAACGVLFVPALFDFEEGRQGPPEHPLADRPEAAFVEGAWGRPEIEPDLLVGLWLEARLRAVFRSPATVLERPALHCSCSAESYGVPVVAVTGLDEGSAGGPSSSLVLTPFVYGGALTFPTGTDVGLAERIASAFCALLFRAPDELATFDVVVYDEGEDESEWLECGHGRGGFYCWEPATWVSDDPLREYPTHEVHLFPEPQACEECGGGGEEPFCPAGGPCEACGGEGVRNASCAWPVHLIA
jgi:hypothetical protein